MRVGILGVVLALGGFAPSLWADEPLKETGGFTVQVPVTKAIPRTVNGRTVVETVTETQQVTITIGFRLLANGFFKAGGGLVINGANNGPLTNLRDENGTQGRIENGDVIVQIDNQKVTGPQAYYQALNEAGQKSGGHVRLTIRDKNSGAERVWNTKAVPVGP